jgi:hypothetical protein
MGTYVTLHIHPVKTRYNNDTLTLVGNWISYQFFILSVNRYWALRIEKYAGKIMQVIITVFFVACIEFHVARTRNKFCWNSPTIYDVERAPSMGMRCYTVSRWVTATGRSRCSHLLETVSWRSDYKFLRNVKADLTPHTTSQSRRQQILYRMKYIMFSFGCFPGIWVLIADVSEHSISSILKIIKASPYQPEKYQATCHQPQMRQD